MNHWATYIMEVGESAQVTINIHGKEYKINFEKIYESKSIERYRIFAGGKEIQVRNDRPAHVWKSNFHTAKWKAEKGTITDEFAFKVMCHAIQGYWRRRFAMLNPFVHPKNEPRSK